MRIKNSLFLLILLLYLLSCEQKKTELVWEQSFYLIGSQSSPRAADFNKDGILDIVIGAGKGEVAYTEQAIIALDGKTGQLLWQQESSGHMLGSASLYDITGDKVKDVFIGGRDHNLKAIDGSTGKLIWQYEYVYENDPILQYAKFNFYNSQLVPDQTQDGIPDLLIVNGGNHDAAPYSVEDRFPGVLMLFDLRTGEIIAADTMPDGQESYMSPLYVKQADSKEGNIIFGTGGETAGGNVYMATLTDLMETNLKKNARILASETNHGFIAPPVLVDITNDGLLDIIAISHAAKIIALDGADQHLIWEQGFEQMESSTSLVVGYFNEDKTPDIFASLNKGTWPNYTTSFHAMLNGKTGEVLYEEPIGCFGQPAPVVYDLNGDGIEEVIMSKTSYDCKMKFTEEVLSPETIENKLIFLNFKDKTIGTIDQRQGFKNFFSSPWIGDLDEDGYLDVVYTQLFNPKDITRFLGMRIKRVSTAISMTEPPIWGAYMGTKGNGVFIPN